MVCVPTPHKFYKVIEHLEEIFVLIREFLLHVLLFIIVHSINLKIVLSEFIEFCMSRSISVRLFDNSGVARIRNFLLHQEQFGESLRLVI